jgi:hypothetical protein
VRTCPTKPPCFETPPPLKAYARIANDRENWANAEIIRRRAVRKIGEPMDAQREAGLLAKGGGDQKSNHRGTKNPSDLITLAEVGMANESPSRTTEDARRHAGRALPRSSPSQGVPEEQVTAENDTHPTMQFIRCGRNQGEGITRRC